MGELDIHYNKSIDEEFTRTNHATNAKGLTPEDIEKRDIETAEMMKLFPKLNPLWCDLAWNFVHRTPPERVREIIDNKEWETPSQKDFQKGGTYLGGEVQEKTEEELNKDNM